VTSSWFFLSTLNYDARSTTHQIQQDRQCTYTVKLRNVRATILAVESNEYYVLCVFVALGTQHEMQSYICGLLRCKIFFHFISYAALNTKCVFLFSQKFVSQTLLILRRNERDMTKNIHQTFGAGIIFLMLAHPVYKMRIIQEPNTLEL